MLKRVLLCLALMFTLCFCLCACDSELPPEKLEPLYGTWIVDTAFDGEHKAMEGAAFLITFAEDGQFYFDDQGGMTWIARESRDSENIVITVREDKKVVYKFVVYPEDERNIRYGWLTDKKEEQHFGSFVAISNLNTPNIDWTDKLFAQWYPAANAFGGDAPLIMNADGTCVIGSNTYNWIEHPYFEEQPNATSLFIFNDKQGCGTLRGYMLECGLPHINLEAYEPLVSNARSDYLWHPMVDSCLGWHGYQAFDKNNPVGMSIHLDTANALISEENLKWQLSDKTTTEQMVLCIPDANAPQYTLTIAEDGEYINLALEVMETGEIINYYHQSHGYDPANPEYIYYDAISAINCYLNDSYYWNETLEYDLFGNDILSYAYARFQEVADYKESQSYLDRFTIVPNKLATYNVTRADKMGNTETFEQYSYNYDTQGRLSNFYDYDAVETFGVVELQNYIGYLTYDANNVITDLTLKSGDSIQAKCTPTYDDAGNMISMHVLTNSGEYTSTFTYNEQGQLVKLEIPYYGNLYIYTYTYDEAGLLIQKTRDYYSYCEYNYTYENGRLAQETISVSQYGEDWTVVTTFAYDAQGTLVSKTTTSDQSSYPYAKEEFVYVYKDIYFYAAE